MKLVRNYDLLSIIMLYLGGPDGELYDGALRMLGMLLSSETSEAERRRIMQGDYDIQTTRTMEKKASVVCNLSKDVVEKGMAKEMEQSILLPIKSFMEMMGWTIERAVTALKVLETERQIYLNLPKKQA